MEVNCEPCASALLLVKELPAVTAWAPEPAGHFGGDKNRVIVPDVYVQVND
jgi:hypothetical protein